MSSDNSYYIFNYNIIKDNDIIGKIVLRNGKNLEILGNIGIEIDSKYRKNGYAKKALSILKGIASMYEQEELIYTCYEENKDSIEIASANGFKKINEVKENDKKIYVYKCKLEKEKII